MSLPSRRGLFVCSALLAGLTLLGTGLAGWRLIEEELALRDLNSGDESARRAAARKLIRLRSARAVPRLISLMHVGIKSTRESRDDYAAQALIKIGSASVAPLYDVLRTDSHQAENIRQLLHQFEPEASDAFIAAAYDPCVAVRTHALYWLGKVAGERRKAFECLAEALTANEDQIRLAALSGLSKSGSTAAIPLLLAKLEAPSESSIVRYWAAYDLPNLGAPAMRVLRKALKHEDALVRVLAANALNDYQPAVKEETIPILVEALRAQDWKARQEAISTLSRAECLPLPEVERCLVDPREEVRSAAVGALTRLKPTQNTVPALIAMLERKEGGQDPADVLGMIGPPAAAAVPALIAALEREEDEVRWSATDALGQIGPSARAAVPALIRALEKGSISAMHALGRVGPDAVEAVPAMVATLSGSNWGDAGLALIGLGPGAVPKLIPFLQTSEDELRCQIINVLADFGPVAKEAIPQLLEILKADDWNISRYAIRALGRIGHAAAPAAPLLSECLERAVREDDWEATLHTAEALGRIGPVAKLAVPILLDAIRLENNDSRAAAILALGRLEAREPACLAALRAGISAEDPLVRTFAAISLLHLRLSDAKVQEALGAGFAAEKHQEIVHAMEGFPQEAGYVLSWLTLPSSPSDPLYAIRVSKLLGALGRDARSARPWLEALSKTIRTVAGQTMGIDISYSPQLREHGVTEALEAIEEALRTVGIP